MRSLPLAIAWLGAGLVSACDVPLEHFHGAGAGADAAPGDDAPADAPAAAFGQEAYVKASNTGSSDHFGYSVALSADGSTLAVGVPDEDSAATGVGGNPDDESAQAAGAVYVFTRTGAGWAQQAYLKASNTGAGDQFGYSVALSTDGSTLAVGAIYEDSAGTGTTPQADNTAVNAGAVYVFTRSGATWTQQAYVKARNADAGHEFGYSVALSGSGAMLAVGAHKEPSSATGVFEFPQVNNGSPGAGAVYVFTRNGTSWSEQSYIKASNTGADDLFGEKVALSADGSTLAVSAIHEDSAGTGAAPEADNSFSNAGAVYVFAGSGNSWIPQAYVKAPNAGAGDLFGFGLGLSADGSILAVGAYAEGGASSGASATPPSPDDNSLPYAGAAYVFARTGTTWSPQAYIKASNPGGGSFFGYALALSADGATLAVGAHYESGAGTGVNPPPGGGPLPGAGATYLFTRSGAAWTQRAYVKASNTDNDDHFGASVALSGDGATLAVGAVNECSGATGVDGTEADEAAPEAGAVYVFR